MSCCPNIQMLYNVCPERGVQSGGLVPNVSMGEMMSLACRNITG